jgi:hypothetical protein
VPHRDGREAFLNMVQSHEQGAPKFSDCVDALRDRHPERMPGKMWRDLCEELTTHVIEKVAQDSTKGGDLAFCMAQQVSSALRSLLAYEVQSRLDATPKWWRFW